MEIIKQDNGKKGAFIAVDNDMEIGEMTYIWSNDYQIIIDHTEVSSGYEGRGIGKDLFTKAIEFARENKISIIPVCPFVKTMFRRHPETGDVLAR